MESVVNSMENSLQKFYSGKRILLTGHTGFKGTWMSLFLETLGAQVCGYSLPLNKYSFYGEVKPEVFRHEEGDIADEKKVYSVAETFRPDMIFHFASHSSLNGSMEIPDFILRTNLMGVVNILEVTRKVDSVKAVVVVTSDKCYQNMETDQAYTEEAPLGAKDPYSTSKVCQELLTACYMDTFFQNADRPIGVATARASNVIGPGDYNITRLLPYLLDSFSNHRIPQIRNPHAIRPWQYVLDVLSGYLLLAQSIYESRGIGEGYNGAYNFGPGKDGFAKVGDVARRVSESFGGLSYEIKPGNDNIKHEAKILKLDSAKAKAALGWTPKVTLQETLTLTVDFIEKQKSGLETGQLARKYVQTYLRGVYENV